MCWKDGQLVDELWVALGTSLPDKSEMTDHGPYSQDNDGWSTNYRFDLKILATYGVPEEINAQFTTSSKGGQSAIGSMMKQWVRDCKEGSTEGGIPVVLFDSSFYQNKKYGGKTLIPTMTIARYVPSGSIGTVKKVEADKKKSAAKSKKPDLE
jgi:hypothetical protein